MSKYQIRPLNPIEWFEVYDAETSQVLTVPISKDKAEGIAKILNNNLELQAEKEQENG